MKTREIHGLPPYNTFERTLRDGTVRRLHLRADMNPIWQLAARGVLLSGKEAGDMGKPFDSLEEIRALTGGMRTASVLPGSRVMLKQTSSLQGLKDLASTRNLVTEEISSNNRDEDWFRHSPVGNMLLVAQLQEDYRQSTGRALPVVEALGVLEERAEDKETGKVDVVP